MTFQKLHGQLTILKDFKGKVKRKSEIQTAKSKKLSGKRKIGGSLGIFADLIYCMREKRVLCPSLCPSNVNSCFGKNRLLC
jgi:hypothetical protein